jgi:hypothetical protein
MHGHRRTKDGVASLAYDPRIHEATQRPRPYGCHPLRFMIDCRVKPGHDRGERSTPSTHYNFSNFFALPEKIASFSACDISSAFTAAMVLRINPRPCSESNGASVANTHLSVPKKA